MIRHTTIRIPIFGERIRLTGFVVIYPGMEVRTGDLIVDPRRVPNYPFRREVRVKTTWGSTFLSRLQERRFRPMTIRTAQQWQSNPYRWAMRKVNWAGNLEP